MRLGHSKEDMSYQRLFEATTFKMIVGLSTCLLLDTWGIQLQKSQQLQQQTYAGSQMPYFGKLKIKNIGESLFNLAYSFSNLPKHNICQLNFGKLLEMAKIWLSKPLETKFLDVVWFATKICQCPNSHIWLVKSVVNIYIRFLVFCLLKLFNMIFFYNKSSRSLVHCSHKICDL